jgi:cyclopropane fatty-acyl-phospholipid synthase-like methyltransferase
MSACEGAACGFGRDYELAQSPVMLEIERRVRDADYGATSWTTRAQAEQTVARLGLAPGQRLLDIGAGSGWPGLFLAKLSGCEAVLTDLPLSGLRIARSRAEREDLQDRCTTVAADGAALPFADRSFDRIHHADVLCCMERKHELLAECRRVAKPGARMEFSAIWLVRDPSSAEEQALLQQSGPAYPDAGADYASLLDVAAWRLVDRMDVTTEFARCLDVLLEASQGRRAELVELLGERDFAERLARRHSTRSAVARGLLRREIFVAVS